MLATDMLVPQDLETMDASGDDASLDGGDASLDGGDGGGWTFPTDSCARAFFASGSDPLAPSPAAQLTDILDACPALKSAIMWQTPTGSFVGYDDLGVERTDRIEELYAALVRGDEELGVACPDPTTRTKFSGATHPRATYLTAAEAFDVFAAHVAHVFYVEASRQVDWSLTSMHPLELAELLSSDRYQSIIPILPAEAYAMGYGLWHDLVTAGVDYQLNPRSFAAPGLICDPRDGARFLSGENSTSGESLLASTQQETLANMTLWASENFYHGDCSGPDCDVPEYKFFLRDRLRYSAMHARITVPLGCHSAQNVLYDLARSINIPLRAGSMRQTLNDNDYYFFFMNHGALVFDFAGENPRILQHVDDDYAVDSTPPILLRAGEGAVSRREIAATMFDAMWATRAELEAFNFEVATAFPIVHPGDRYGGMISAYEEYADFGPMVGAWMPVEGHEPLDSTPAVEGANYPAGMAQYTLYQQMQVCGARLVEDYCFYEAGGIESFRTGLATRFRGTTFPEAYDIDTSIEALWARAGECAMAAGGCTLVPVLRDEIEATYGANTWMD